MPLAYFLILFTRGQGLEPRLMASKATVLPLDDPRTFSEHSLDQPATFRVVMQVGDPRTKKTII